MCTGELSPPHLLPNEKEHHLQKKEDVCVLPILVTLAVAFAFGYTLDRLKVPGGMMIGAVIGTCLLGVTTGYAQIPKIAKTTAQVIAGAFIGAGVSREEMREMRTVVKPAAILLPGLLVINIVAGLLIFLTGPIDLMTALMSCTPGGISDIPMIAADLGADTSKVTLMQFVRFMMGIALFPSLIRIITKDDQKEKETVLTRKKVEPSLMPTLLTLAVAAFSGWLGMISPMPSGTMAGAVLGSILFKYFYPRAQTPRFIRKAAQCLSGAYVGASIGMQQIAEIPFLLLPIVILLGCYLFGAFVISKLLVKAKCFNRTEAMLAATPAGASDMALISADLGVQNVKLILLQVLRLVVVISFFPAILKLVASAFGY